MNIFTIAIANEAVELVRSAAEKILLTPGTTWGPKWVEGRIRVPESEEIISFLFGDPPQEWDPEWGEEIDFGAIAEKELHAMIQRDANNSIAVKTKPWLLEPGVGGAPRNGICVAICGARGDADEAMAEMVISVIEMLAFLEIDEQLQKEENKKI